MKRIEILNKVLKYFFLQSENRSYEVLVTIDIGIS